MYHVYELGSLENGHRSTQGFVPAFFCSASKYIDPDPAELRQVEVKLLSSGDFSHGPQ